MTEQTENSHREESPEAAAEEGGGLPNIVISREEDKPIPESSIAVAGCLSNLISSVIQEFDSKAEQTLRSQDQLSGALDRLTGELDQLLDDAPLPFIMQHAARISGARKRVTSLNSVLKSIQRRVDNIERIMSSGSTLQGAPSSVP